MAEVQKGIGVEALLEIWNRRKWLAFPVFLAPFALVTTIALSLPDLYKTTAKVLIGRQEVSDAFVRSSVTSEVETRLHMIGQEILSRSQLLELINRFDLYAEMRKQAPIEAVIDQMRRDIRIEHDRTEMMYGRGATISFSLSFRGRDPVMVANVANTLANLYIQHNVKIRERQVTETTDFLGAQLAELKKTLEEEERRISAFKERHIGELPEQLEANLSTLQRLNTELRLAKETQMRTLERIEMEGLRRQLTQAAIPDRAVDAEHADSAVARRMARLAQLEQELAELRTRYSEKYPDVVRAKAEITALEQELARVPGRGEGSGTEPGPAKDPPGRLKRVKSEAETTLERLREEEQKLRQAIAQYQLRVDNAPRRELELQELTRNYKATKEHYQTLLQRHEDAKLAESMEQSQKAEQFRVLEPAIPPTLPAAPRRAKFILFGFILSLGLAGAAVVAAELYDTSFHSLEDLRVFTTVAVLASIPRMVTGTETRRRLRLLQLGAAAAVIGLAVIIIGSYHLSHDNEALARLVAWGRT